MAKQKPLSPADCDAVILAGGKATRLQSVVSDRPKILAEIDGLPFAHYLLNQLLRAGFHRAIICTGHLADMVEGALGHCWHDMELVYSREEEALDTGGAIRLALPQLAGRNAVVINGDTFVQIDFAAMLQRFETSGAAAALALVDVPDPQRYGSVKLSPDGYVMGFHEKNILAQPGQPASINAGIYVLPPQAIAMIPLGRKVSVEREIMPRWIEQGLLGISSPGPFIDIGTPESFGLAQTVLREWAD